MIWPILWTDMVKTALLEDLGGMGDVTTDSVVDADLKGVGRIVAREKGTLAGGGVVREVYGQLDPELAVVQLVADGEDFQSGQTLLEIQGTARAILTGERVTLNFLGRACGIATTTRAICRLLEGTSTRVVATRKTTPGLRRLEKHAVVMGGGGPHRFGLDDAVMIKDNHVAAAGGVAEAMERARHRVGHLCKIELEVDTLEQLEQALPLQPDVVLLDNMDLATLRQAVEMVAGACLTEASGGITAANVRQVAETGVDLISMGSLTHSSRCLDVSMEFSTGSNIRDKIQTDDDHRFKNDRTRLEPSAPASP